MSLIRRVMVAASLSLALNAVSAREPHPTLPATIPLSIPGFHAAAVLPTALPPATVSPSPTPTATAIPTPVPLSAATTVLDYPPPPILARAAILVDMQTGKVLFAQHADERLPMASTTKITTAALALQHGGLNDLVRISEKAATIGESTMELVKGERLTVRQLLYGLLLNSANDAAIALAEHDAGTEARFVGQMNRLARDLHMSNTHYVTPHGLDEPGHYSSARDLATIAMYAMRDPLFRRIVDTANYHILATKHNREHWLANINYPLFWYPGVDGVKPGDTDAAGMCQVIAVNRDGRHLLAVLLNTPTLVNDIRNLLNFGLRDFRWVQAPAYWDSPANTISGGHGAAAWVYYYGAGHYIRGPYLQYFHSHGGLSTLGYPLTDIIVERGRRVQYFQGAELIAAPSHHSVYPAPLGSQEQGALAKRAERSGVQVDPALRPLYKRLGGTGVLGRPVGRMTSVDGNPVQFFRYAELGLVAGVPYVVPVGSVAMRAKGWLPAPGAPDALPSTMSARLIWWPPAHHKPASNVTRPAVPLRLRLVDPGRRASSAG